MRPQLARQSFTESRRMQAHAEGLEGIWSRTTRRQAREIERFVGVVVKFAEPRDKADDVRTNPSGMSATQLVNGDHNAFTHTRASRRTMSL